MPKTPVAARSIGRATALCLGAVTTLLAVLLPVGANRAEAAFAGTNGKIAFTRAGDVWVMNFNGTGEKKLTSNIN